MLRFFYKTRTICGLVLIISPMLAILFTDRPVSFWLPFLCMMTVSVPIFRGALQSFPFRISVALFTALFLAGIFFTESSLSPLLLGCGSCILLLLPPSVMEGSYKESWIQPLAAVWSLSALGAPLLQQFFSQTEEFTATVSFICFTAAVLLLKKPQTTWKFQAIPIVLGQRKLFLKPSFYAVTISSSLVISFSMMFSAGLTSESFIYKPFQPAALFWLCLAAAPILASAFAEKKGVFASCIFLIFLCEGTMFFLAFFNHPIAFAAGGLFLAFAFGCLTVVVPLLAFYLYGHINYLQNLSRLLFMLPLGMLLALPFLALAEKGMLIPAEAAVVLLTLLIMSFFCIFFAWKQRFIILKNEIL